jgi:hypothetical protein
MTDPIAANLWFLLNRQSAVHPEDVCWFNNHRARCVLLAAGMVPDGNELWTTTPSTAIWFQDMFDEIRMYEHIDHGKQTA